MKNQEYKKVKDLTYAGVLKSQNFKLQNINWENGTAWFVFEDNGDAESILTAFINGELKGNIKKYDDALKTLKQMLFSNKNKK